MPQPKNQAPEEAHTSLQKGEHNPFLEGLLEEGKAANDAIQGWYATRDNLRQLARQAVNTGFASPQQAEAVAKLWPMPNRKSKTEGEQDTTPATTAA